MDKAELKKKIENADLVLVGIGEEFCISDNSENDINDAYKKLHELIGGKNYFIVSQTEDELIFDSNLDKTHITAPFSPIAEQYIKKTDDGDIIDEAWDKYMKWLSCTLNKKLIIIELGVLLNKPQVIRWPFEKTVMLNNKAELVRINEKISNIPSDIAERAISVSENAVDFLLND